MQRRLFRHGFGVLTAGFVLGLVVGAMDGAPRARLWLGSHVTAILIALFIVGVATAWPHLALGNRGRRALFALTVYGNWFGFAILGVFAPAVGFTSKISTPNLPPPPSWAAGVVGLGILVTTISSFAICALVLYGLRGAEGPARVAEPAPAE